MRVFSQHYMHSLSVIRHPSSVIRHPSSVIAPHRTYQFISIHPTPYPYCHPHTPQPLHHPQVPRTRAAPHALPAPQCRTPNLSTQMNRPLSLPTPAIYSRTGLHAGSTPLRPVHMPCSAVPVPPCSDAELVAGRPASDRIAVAVECSIDWGGLVREGA